MIYRGMNYTVLEVAPGRWRWTVKIGDHLERSGTTPSQATAELKIIGVINRALAIKRELAERPQKPVT
jgi:hypothetical protein